ncbi:MAG: hypothetical protein AB7D03_02795 [Thiomicrospira sp.]
MMSCRFILKVSSAMVIGLLSAGCVSDDNRAAAQALAQGALSGDYRSPLLFENPYAHVPAQCYIETSNGRQNACLYCHTNGVYDLGFGNNNPQAGRLHLINFQVDYGFDPHSTTAPFASVNRWENTLYPQKLANHVAALNINPQQWDMNQYIKTDNWQSAFDQRSGSPLDWDSGFSETFRFLPGLDPRDLPADADGFVRSSNAANGYFEQAGIGYVTGWRAINFMPYGIFTPLSGSVSGIYIRLPERFMKNDAAQFDLTTYQQNLDLLHRAITHSLNQADPTHYFGQAKDEKVRLGVYPKGTEFAHPLHYVDVEADGIGSRYPGTRAQRVKEVRWMYKFEDYNPMDVLPESAGGDGLYGNDQQGWIDNGAGWILAGFIEDSQGTLRAQNREELAQCLGCHSGFTANTVKPTFTSGLGNTIDSTWALPRKFAGQLGWQEMNYLGYRIENQHAVSTIKEPLNRYAQKGEFGLLLDYVVGASLYGDMPEQYEQVFVATLTTEQGYSANWPRINTASAEAFDQSAQARQTLLREYVAKGGYLTEQGTIKGFLLYPTQVDALENARRYRQVVVTQRYHFGKDVFAATPTNFFHYRRPGSEEKKTDGQRYQFGELITEREVQLEDPARFDYRAGVGVTLIDENKPFEQGGTFFPNYVPLISAIE